MWFLIYRCLMFLYWCLRMYCILTFHVRFLIQMNSNMSRFWWFISCHLIECSTRCYVGYQFWSTSTLKTSTNTSILNHKTYKFTLYFLRCESLYVTGLRKMIFWHYYSPNSHLTLLHVMWVHQRKRENVFALLYMEGNFFNFVNFVNVVRRVHVSG